MSGLEIVGVGMTVAGAYMNAKSQRLQGLAQKRALDYQAQQQRQQAEYTEIAGKQAEAGTRDALTTSLQQISALQAGRGVGSASPTVSAITNDVIDRGERDVATKKLDVAAKASQLRTGATLATQQGELAESAGERAAWATMIGAGTQLTNLYNYGRTQRSAL